jgi:predicted DCC family thiol-disulfide oxidoreductase YuxK
MNTKLIIIFDGNCNLCNHSVKYIVKKDIKKKFIYLSNESDEAKQLLESFKLIESSKSSIVFIENNRVFLKSTAVLKIAKHLSGAIKLASLFIIIPRIFRDPIYDLVSRYRHRLFKKPPECVINSDKIQ